MRFHGLMPLLFLGALAGCANFEYPSNINMSSAVPPMDAGTAAFCGKTIPSTPIGSLVDAFGAEPVKSFVLVAQVVTRAGLPDEWAFNGTVPGPELRVNRGDHVRVQVINNLPEGVTIHWHGVRIANAEDGVAGLTQDAIAPGSSFTYDFIARDAGTYWYHSHQNTEKQVPRGLFGSLIVDDPSDHTAYAHDFVTVYHDSSDVRLTGFQVFLRILSQRFGGNKRGETQVNETGSLVLSAKPGDLVRVRIVNAISGEMPGAPLRLAVQGADAEVRAIDGHDLNGPQPIGKRLLAIGMGQRYDLVFRVPPAGSVVLRDPDQGETVTIGSGPGLSVERIAAWPSLDLSEYGAPAPDALGQLSSFDATYNLELGEMPGHRQGRTELVHTINGKAFPDAPMITVREGQAIKLHITNRTDEYHPMHLHGHVFTILALNGKPMRGSTIRADSVLIGPHQSADVAFMADNPGLWMFHCHVLLHAAFGMDMMIVYPNISTPFTVGSVSGNIPD